MFECCHYLKIIQLEEGEPFRQAVYFVGAGGFTRDFHQFFFKLKGVNSNCFGNEPGGYVLNKVGKVKTVLFQVNFMCW